MKQNGVKGKEGKAAGHLLYSIIKGLG